MKTTRTIRLPIAKREEILVHIRGLPQKISGRMADDGGMRDNFWKGFLVSLFTSIHTAFLQKSEGGTDELGDKWKPLARSTIAARPPKSPKGMRGLLTDAENKVWKGIFASHYAKLLARGTPDLQAKGLAAKLAWAILKSRGAKTRLSVYGSRKVPILIDSGRLEQSLRPNKSAGKFYTAYNPDQVVRVRGGTIEVGTKVFYAEHVNKVRRLWPKRSGLWTKRAIDAGVKHLVEEFK